MDEVSRLCKHLIKAVEDADVEEAILCLDALDRVDMTLSLMQSSKAGIAVAKLRTHGTKRLADRAHDVYAKWRRIAEAAGVSVKSRAPSSQVGGSVSRSSSDVAAAASSSSQEVTADSSGPASSPATSAAPSLPDAAPAASIDASSSPSASAPVLQLRSDAAEVGKKLPGARTRTWKVLADSLHASGKKLTSAAASDLPAEADVLRMLADTVALDVEEALWNALGGEYPIKPMVAYSDQFKLLALGFAQNAALAANVLSSVQPIAPLLTATSDDLASEASRKAAEAARAEHVNSVMLDWASKNKKAMMAAAGIRDVEGLFRCPRCKSKNTDYYEKQTRSADEPMTKFCNCADCGTNWRFC